MRKALVVGIDYYNNSESLTGCVNDAFAVKSVLERHMDGTKNFDVNLKTATGPTTTLERRELKDLVISLFEDDSEIALFYFSGHGHVESTGGYLITSECLDGDDGFALNDLMEIANHSKAKNRIIILDCCHSGIAGARTIKEDHSLLKEGTTILTASGANQYAVEQNDGGVFTTLFVDAMNGGASNLVGDITPGSIYAHIDQSLGSWQQRPIFKTNVKYFTTLRKVLAPIDLLDLKELTRIFPRKGDNYRLDPTYEPESDNPNPDKVKVFKLLQKYNRINLVVPVDAEHMYFAAMYSKSCKLTVLGEHYWNLIANDRI